MPEIGQVVKTRRKLVSIDSINPSAYNPRVELKPGDIDYEKLKKSIEDFGLVQDLVWNERTGTLVGGHQRLSVLKAKGVLQVEVVVVDLDEKRERALNIVLNKAGGRWDKVKLKESLVELDDGQFDIEMTGFDQLEIEELIAVKGDSHHKEIQVKPISFEIVVECQNELHQKELMDKLQTEGHKCRAATL